VMTGREWPDPVPVDQQERLGTTTLRDTEMPQIPATVRDVARRAAEATVQEVRERIFPYHGL